MPAKPPEPKKTPPQMSAETFGELTESLNQALQHARGERTDLRTTTFADVLLHSPLRDGAIDLSRSKADTGCATLRFDEDEA